MKNGQFPEVFNLGDLNGQNGFKLDGENNGDSSGFSVSTAGDINGDGYADLLVGAPYYPYFAGSGQGRSYVVFGGPGVGSSGDILLSSLNGTNGFKLDSENNGDFSGYSVSTAGDINGDGYVDLLIGAYGYPRSSNRGRSYVVFGGTEVGSRGDILLSSLNGTNGFKLDGENSADTSGYSVSAAGDINGDGVADLIIGAIFYPQNRRTGRTYVVFGDIPPVLVNNSLQIYSGQVLRLTTENLAAYDINHDNQTLLFALTEVTHGRFESINSPGIALKSFTQQAVINQSIQFIHDGSTEAPTYNITVRSAGIAWTGSYAANITFFPLAFLNNQLVINQGESVVLTAENLLVTYQGNIDGSLNFLIANVIYGRFESNAAPGHAIDNFQQQNITDQQIRFVHDGGSVAPAYQVAVNKDQTTTPFQPAAIDFDVPPVLVNAYLQTAPKFTVMMTSLNLKASTTTRVAEKLMFEISNLAQGYFAYNDQWEIPILNFTQQEVINNQVVFLTDDSGISPHFDVSVWDGRLYCQPCPQPAKIVFQGAQDSSFSELIKNSLMGALISGGVGFLFFVLKWYINYKHVAHLQRGVRPTIDGLEQGYSDSIVLPIAREIFSRIKIGGCLGYINQSEYNEYVGAVTLIVGALEKRGVIQADNWHQLPRPEKQKIMEAIATQTREIVGNTRCCSTRTFTGFYKAEATPKMIRNQAEVIADAVQALLSDQDEAKRIGSRSGVRLTQTSNTLNNDSQFMTPLLS